MTEPNVDIKWNAPDERLFVANHMAIIQIITNWTAQKIDTYEYSRHPMEKALLEQKGKLIEHMRERELKAQAFDAGIEHIDISLGYLSEYLEAEEDNHIRSILLNEMAALKLVKQMMTKSGDSE